MDLAQNSTLTENNQIESEKNVQKVKLLKAQQEQWITFCALGGLITAESDDKAKPQDIQQMTITEFSEVMKIPRRTLYNWKETIPNFVQRVRERRTEVFGLSRETAAYNRLYLIGMTGKGQPAVDALVKLLGHFSKLELATQRVEHGVSNDIMELVKSARNKKVINEQTTDTGTST